MKTHYLEYIHNSIVTEWNMPALTNYKKNSFTYGEIAQQVARHHILFEKLGLKKGDKVALCGPNSAEWGIAFLAVTSYEAVAVPLLNDFLPESVMTLTDHSESRLFFVSKDIWEKTDIAI
ncbi:MAG: AMP-binding protein, partial [Bacteroidales bacterium]|nr:AMP-binding protein [Bacteroidales bacterium]